MDILQWFSEHILETVYAVAISGIGVLMRFVWKKMKRQQYVELGVQALLRSQIIAIYNKYIEKGEAPIYEKENMRNLYAQYEQLGANGVMSHLYDEFMDLPVPNRCRTE